MVSITMKQSTPSLCWLCLFAFCVFQTGCTSDLLQNFFGWWWTFQYQRCGERFVSHGDISREDADEVDKWAATTMTVVGEWSSVKYGLVWLLLGPSSSEHPIPYCSYRTTNADHATPHFRNSDQVSPRLMRLVRRYWIWDTVDNNVKRWALERHQFPAHMKGNFWFRTNHSCIMYGMVCCVIVACATPTKIYKSQLSHWIGPNES